MNPAETTKIIAESGLSPSVQMVLLIVFILLLLSAPAALFVRDWRKKGRADEQEGTTGDIQTGLYNHLYEQVTLLTTRLDKVHDANNATLRANAELEARVKLLEGCEVMVSRLQVKLNDKDVAIAARDAQIIALFGDLRARDNKIIELQDRLSKLEVRLAADEARFSRAP